MKRLIAESGATKTDWALIDDDSVEFRRSGGLHPLYSDKDVQQKELKKILDGVRADQVVFYGAAALSDELTAPIRKLLEVHLGRVRIHFFDDLTAIAHAGLFEEGIAGILGSGSASGRFRGGEVVERVAALGYVLGDEGSGADMGKRLLRGLFRNRFSPQTHRWLEQRIGKMAYTTVLEKLYRSSKPSYWLAGLAGKVFENEVPEELMKLVDRSLESWVSAHYDAYGLSGQLPVVLTGGIANRFEESLSRRLQERGVGEVRIVEKLIVLLADREVAGTDNRR
ncbi:MAG: hypothetical protein WD315_04975 [Balneolaceae bacterium]